MPLPRFIPLALLLSLAGCGYHQAGPATHLPAGVRTLAIPIFKTNVQAYRTEAFFTQSVVREFNTRTRYRILNSDSEESPSADATLHGTILSEQIAPLTYDPSSGQTSSYLVTITARIVLTARDGHVLYENGALAFREQFQSTQDLGGFIQEDTPAVQRIGRDFARTLVSDILESF